jgi:hypothetical protein
VALFGFLLDFGTVPRVWHCLVFYWTLELFRQCGIIGFSFFYWTLELFRQCGFICFSMGLWDYSHSVALLMYLLDFGTDQRVWHYLVFYWALELFPQCDIIGFSIALWN